jgi:hypothetical protein
LPVAGQKEPVLSSLASPRCLASRDLSVLLDMLTGTELHSSLKGQVGFVWLAAEHLAGEGMNDGQGAEEPPSTRPAVLGHLALRLFLVRELTCDGALVAVRPVPGLEACTVLLMEAVFGQRPQRATLDAFTADAPQLLICRKATDAGCRPADHGWTKGKRAPVADWMAHTPASVRGLTALAMRPGRHVMPLMKAWDGEWILSHPDLVALAALQEQAQQWQWMSRLTTLVTAREPAFQWSRQAAGPVF